MILTFLSTQAVCMLLSTQGRKLHSKALDVALEHFGADHATATLARGNLVDVLDAVGEVDAARSLLKDSLTAVVDICEKKEQEEATAANGKDTTAVAQKPQVGGLADDSRHVIDGVNLDCNSCEMC